jgi:hypothetical protein
MLGTGDENRRGSVVSIKKERARRAQLSPPKNKCLAEKNTVCRKPLTTVYQTMVCFHPRAGNPISQKKIPEFPPCGNAPRMAAEIRCPPPGGGLVGFWYLICSRCERRPRAVRKVLSGKVAPPPSPRRQAGRRHLHHGSARRTGTGGGAAPESLCNVIIDHLHDPLPIGMGSWSHQRSTSLLD